MRQGADFGLTVGECLAIPPMDQGRVVAGAAGLSRRLRWVHVIDHDDVESALMGGELVLTSGVTLGHDQALQRAIFPVMRRLEIAGLVIALGPYMDQVPEAMRADAERHAIPLIALPWAVNFRDVTHALLTRLVASHYIFLENAERLNRDLLDIVLQRAGLSAICARLSEQLGRCVAIADPAFQLLARHEAGACDLFAGDALSPAALAVVVHLRRPVSETQALRTPAGRVLGSATPILAASRLTGWLLLDAPGGEIASRPDVLAAEAAAMVAGLLILQAEDVARAGQGGRDQLLLDVLRGTVGPAPDVAAALGLEPTSPCFVLVAAPRDPAAVETAARIAGSLLARQGLLGCTAPLGREVLAVIQGPRAAGFAAIWSAALDRAALPAWIAVSHRLPELGGLSAGYRDAARALRLSRAMQPDRAVVSAADMAGLSLFLRGVEEAGTSPASFPAVTLLRGGDKAGGVLIETLEQFLEHDGNVSTAARALGVHRHTLLYRLDRITERLGGELTAAVRLELRLQLLAWRLAGTP